MSRVIVPYSHLLDEPVLRALAGVNVELRNVSKDDEAYWRLLGELWSTGQTFTIVEQDIVVRPDTLSSFANCPNGWCGAGYAYLGSRNYVGLGCTRFRAGFIAEFPDLIEHAGEYHDDKHTRKHWCSLDAAMQFVLRDAGRYACTAHGTVEHLGDGRPSHGCCG